ncbi:MAG: restriction endonuclease [Actinomycetota bacterium]|nr:restriction endonuclease [Actinomycetota bacterium]
MKPGQSIKRVDLHQEFGGRGQGGIGPSAQSPNVFIFSDPEAGEPHGYYDGWQEDGCFHYTGEGQRGDQEMKSGNAAILNHIEEGRSLRLFQGARGTVTYVDEFEIDGVEPFYLTDAPETNNGPRRQVIVFRLRPKAVEPREPSSELAPILSGPRRSRVPIERQHTEKAYVEPSREPYRAERREQSLVLSLEKHLLAAGHEVFRNRILPPGEARPLFTDLYDATTRTLVEAKGTVERNAIRMAIGQLADYSRFLEEVPAHLAVLVPSEPRKDLCELLFSQGIDLIYPRRDGFDDSTGGALVDPID